MTDTITITGATGDVGGKTLEQLRGMGATVRAVARRPEQIAKFEKQGIQAALSTLDDLPSLTRVFEGSDQVLIVTAGGKEQALHGRNAVLAAKQAGVRAIVHLSTGDANPASSVPWARAPWHTDELIKMSGLEYTILHPSAFMQNLTQFAIPIKRGFFPQTTGRGAVAWTDTNDIARVAATILHNGQHSGSEPLITGPVSLTSREVADIFSKVLGRRIRYVHLPSRVFAGIIRLGGGDAWTAEGLRQQFARVVRHGLDHAGDRSDDVQKITGTPATSLEAWVRANRNSFVSS
ncbi:NmrA family NAD(P)-binding protein [Curtobacterium sp. VKM Ac-2861]|uniref:NmrA family NAD(P)-binding protein n=1 Tax=Curtobacterium sp. VKM Ac-2861 TaxID=2739016 RepID=UPI001566EC1F|nr:NmrA family NAD(P)-binding protein [Curtobacterium sp. VKM Ac-2861]